jgi:hypothetical protein
MRRLVMLEVMTENLALLINVAVPPATVEKVKVTLLLLPPPPLPL